MKIPTLRTRSSGVLLHPTSLPGPHGSGDLGPAARHFVDFLASAAQRWWQMLPVGPPGYGNSPYSAESALAGNPLLISLEDLADEGLLPVEARLPLPPSRSDQVDFKVMGGHRQRALRSAFRAFEGDGQHRPAYEAYCAANATWLEDFALFRALKHSHDDRQWTRWPLAVRRREPQALEDARRQLASELAYERFLQFTFDRQWTALRAYAAQRGIGLLGDLPIFAAHDSADVWQAPQGFQLDAAGEPTFVAGVPPDYFSATGQRWGNPLYRWRYMKRTGYAWWIARLRMALQRFDAIRLDHFIGFQRYWQIPAGEPTATRGRWMKGPGVPFFDAVRRALGEVPFIAEDLGEVSPAVFALRDRFRLPGIKILQFAFGSDPSAPLFLPHNFPRRAVVYTGTHDNDTTVGWFQNPGGGAGHSTPEQVAREREAALRYLGSKGEEIHWDMIRLALGSVARLAIFPLQDLLGLGTEARMNRPGQAAGNWAWRCREGVLSPELAARAARLTRAYGRAPAESA